MERKFLLVAVLIFVIAGARAQSFTVKGKLGDMETKAPVQGATLILKSLSDSTYSFNAVSDAQGHFEWAGLRKDSFNLRGSSLTNESFVRKIVVNGDVDLGIIVLAKSAKELTGVTVTGTPPPAVQKGDTVQFSASQFKVNPDATSEDLAKKIPGITIENGQVKANGENVKRVTVDGRELFGDDATAALRNLPAEIVDKIQVFDRLSDQAQLTGFNDGNTSKEINIVTKANMRNGQYGRVFAGYGTDNRYLAGGNTTLLNKNRRISLVGNFNNVNQQNFSAQDLLGVTSSGGGGRGNFGGGGRGGGGPQGGGGGNFLTGQQNGINQTNALGINYSDQWGTKVKLSGSYFFNNTKNETDQQTNTQYFLKNIPSYNQSTVSTSSNTNHRVNMRLEYKLDSFNQIIFSPNLSFQTNNSNGETTTSSYFSPTQKVSDIVNKTKNDRNGNNLSSNLLYSHSFRKRGRSFSVNLNSSYNQRNGDAYVDLLTTKYNNGVPRDTAERRYTDQYNNGLQLNTNFSYTEPLSQNAQLQFTYNPSYSKSKSDQEAFNYDNNRKEYSLFNDSLSNKFNNITKAQNGGVSYRYGNKNNNANFGVNYQQTTLNSDQVYPRALTVDKTFRNVLPNANVRLKLSTRSNLRFNYRTNTNQPSVSQLQNVYDISNRPFISIGNPDLRQQFTHTVSTNYTFTNTKKGILFVGNVYAQKASNYISNATFVALRGDSAIGQGQTLYRGEQLSKPVNMNGYMSLRSFLTFAVPLKFIKTNFNLNGGVTFSQLPGIVNNLENQSKNYTYSLGTVFASNVSQYVDFTVSYSANFNTVKNEIDASLNNDYFSHNASLQLNLLSKTGWFFQNDLNNQLYKGLTAGFNQSYFLWNMSAGKKIFKSQKGEIKGSVFDLLGQNRSITRNVTESYIQDVQNKVLRQYFMLTFTYKLSSFGKGINTKQNTRSEGEQNNRKEGGGMNSHF